MRTRAQASVEMLVVLIAALLILGVLVDFANTQLTQLRHQKAIQDAEVAIQQIISAANETYSQGPGATKNIQIHWPAGVDASNSRISGNSLIVRVFSTDVVGIAKPMLSGSIPTNEGDKFLRVKAFDGFVAIGDSLLSVSPTFVFSSMNRDENDSATLTITNASSSTASLALTSDWNYSDVNLSLSSDGNISSGGVYVVDVNFQSSSNAIGAYTGSLTISGTFSSKIESLIVPLTAEIFAGNTGSLVTYPSSFSASTQGADTNAQTIQLCNTSTTSIKNITLAPSSGDAGDWIQGIPSISSLDGLSCASVDVTVVVPDGTALSTFTGSIFIQDFSGAHALTLPVTVYVKGMNGVFNWDWSTSTKLTNAILGYTISNTGTKTITLSSIRLRQWWACDTNHSTLDQIRMNGVTVFAESIDDGNVADITDLNIPVLTSYTNNHLIFSHTINDDNEVFIVDVNFTDGTMYSSSAYGNGCGIDTTPPGAVTDLQAIPGPEPGTIQITFTYPGDDGYSGSAVTPIVKYQLGGNALDTNAEWNAATQYTGDIPIEVAGTPGSVVMSGLQVGTNHHLNIRFQDENGNMSPLSNAVNNRPWNEFNFSGNDFNFINFVSSYPGVPPIGVQDVNKFFLHNLRFGSATSGSIAFRIQRDTNTSNQWAMRLDFNSTDVNYVRIWYSAPTNYLQQTPNYEGASSLAYAGGLNLIDDTNFPSSWKYDSAGINMPVPNHFYLDYLVGLIDFNLSMDMGGSGVGYEG